MSTIAEGTNDTVHPPHPAPVSRDPKAPDSLQQTLFDYNLSCLFTHDHFKFSYLQVGCLFCAICSHGDILSAICFDHI